MDKTRDKQLCDKYPEIFRDRNKPCTQTCMAWGFECGAGWYHIIDALCCSFAGYSSCVEFVEDEKPADPTIWVPYVFPQVVADQVKEKYGTLRFYYHLEASDEFLEKMKPYPKSLRLWWRLIDEHIRGAVNMAENMSAFTCEETGKPGVLCQRGSWLKTLCPEKAAELKYEIYVPSDK